MIGILFQLYHVGGRKEREREREGGREESGYCLAAQKIAMTTYQAHAPRGGGGGGTAGGRAGGLAGEEGPGGPPHPCSLPNRGVKDPS